MHKSIKINMLRLQMFWWIGLVLLGCSTALTAQLTPLLRGGAYPKMETEWSYVITNFVPAEQGIKRAERAYNSDGKYTQCRYFSSQSPIVQTYTYDYDDAARQCKYYWQKNEGQRVLEYLEQYNEVGKLCTRFRFRSDGKLIDSLRCHYDFFGRTVEEITYNNKGEVVYQTSLEYDEERDIRIERHQDKITGQLLEIGVEMDANGLPLIRKRYQADGALLDKTEFVRNERGQLIEKRYYRNGKDLDTREIYEYNEQKGQTVWAVYTGGGATLVEYTVMEYSY